MIPAIRRVAVVDPYEAGIMLAPAFRRYGIETLMVQSTPAVPLNYADTFDASSFRAILHYKGDIAEIASVLRAHHVDCVLAGSEWGVNLADQLGELIGVRSNGSRLTEARRNKFRMIEQVARSGLRTPAQFQSNDLSQILQWIHDRHGWPAILKPPHAMSADGVRLCTSKQEAASAFHTIQDHINVLGLRNTTVLAQEFIRGKEYVVDTVSCEGHHRLAAFWAYGKPTPGYSTVGIFTTKELLPADHPMLPCIFEYVTGVLDALEIRHGAAHCEVIVDSHGPVLVEIGARLHGGERAHLMSRAAIGTSQLDLLVQSCLDPVGFLENRKERYRLAKAVVMVLLRSAAGRGTIESLPSVHELIWNARADRLAPAAVAGVATLIHKDRSVVECDLDVLSGGVTCEVLNACSAVVQIVPEWEALLNRSECNRAFSAPGWYLAALDSDSRLSPLVIVARRFGMIAGVFPLAYHNADYTAGFATQLSDYNDIIAAAGDEEVLRRLMSFACEHLANPTRLVLKCLRADSNCVRSSPRVVLGEKHYTCPYADISRGYDAWFATRTHAFQQHLRRIRRRAERNGVRVARLDPAHFRPSELATAFLAMQRERFGERSLFLRDPAARAFAELVIPELFAQGRIIAFGAWHGRCLIGVNICTLGPNSLGYWNAGFRADAHHFSPGALMLDSAVREACVMGLAEFDLLRGKEAYKTDWSTNSRTIGQWTCPINTETSDPSLCLSDT